MVRFGVTYKTYGKATPPQPIRLANTRWAGAPQKMEDGSEVQPWHCLPFVEGSTHGLELVYPYETECHVVGAGGTVQFEWDFTREPGGGLFGGEFKAFSPRHAARFYSFATWIDIVPPPGYALRSEPHPRYFTDETGTVPLAMIGHLQNEWYPRRVFLVFRAPRQGERHIFRKGEPYAQIIFVPQRVSYELSEMPAEIEAQRRSLESAIDAARLDIAENTWHNPEGVAFSNHYKVLARAFARDGMTGVGQTVQKDLDGIAASFPRLRPIRECMEVGLARMKENKFEQAEAIFLHVLEREPQHAAAYNCLGVCLIAGGNIKHGMHALVKAVSLAPNNADYHVNLGEQLRRLGRLGEAEASFRRALVLAPNDFQALELLNLTLAQQGRQPEVMQRLSGITGGTGAAAASFTPSL